ncbi:MAG: hypothetical protein ACI8O8_002538 [Oleiphilaceae bacterium]|jgi:hypothetical protein
MLKPFNQFLIAIILSFLSGFAFLTLKRFTSSPILGAPITVTLKISFKALWLILRKKHSPYPAIPRITNCSIGLTQKRQVMAGNIDGIIGMSHDNDSEAKFFFHHSPLSESQVCFYRRSK